MNPFKISIIAIAAYMMIALTLFLDAKQFILPIGLFKPTLFVVAVLCLITARKKLIWLDWVMILWTLILGLSSKFFLDAVLSQSSVLENPDKLFFILSIAHLLGYLLLLFWMLCIAWKADPLSRMLQIAGGAGMFICFFIDEYIYLMIPTIIWFAGCFLHKSKNETYYALSVFLVFSIAATWITGWYYGAESVLSQL